MHLHPHSRCVILTSKVNPHSGNKPEVFTPYLNIGIELETLILSAGSLPIVKYKNSCN